MKHAVTFAALSVLALSLAHAPALAQGMGQGQGMMGQGQGMMGQGQGMVATQCKDEIAKHCGDVQHGGGAMHTCLSGHVDELSENCKTALKNAGNMGTMGGQGGGMGAEQ